MLEGKNNFIAIDLGASNGRIIIGAIEEKKLELEIAHRFEHGVIEKAGIKLWNWSFILPEINIGLNKACEILGDKKITSISCDSWAQDFGLLDENGNMIAKPVSYRDSRTKGMPESFSNIITPEALLSKNGSAISPITTLCQLKSIQEHKPEELDKAKSLLHIADLIHYSLSGRLNTDWTMATASQMWNINNDEWDKELLRKLDINGTFLQTATAGPHIIGHVSKEKAPHPNIEGVPIISCAGHDTAAASATLLPLIPGTLFLSLGTWGMLGCAIGKELKIEKYSYDSATAFLGLPFHNWGIFKGTTGMWPLQECRKEWTDNGKKLKWDEIDEMTGNSNIDSIIDLAHPSLFAPLRMTEAIKSLSSKNSQCIPKNPGDFSRTIINSLAEDISKNILSLKNITGFSFENINIIGGGARNSLLCDTIAEKSKLNVIKGAPEASATGNILLQAIATGVIKNVNEVGSYIKKWT